MSWWASQLIGLIVASTCMFGGGVLAATAQTEVTLTIENHRIQPEEIRVTARTPFVLVITNKDTGPEEFESSDLRIEKVIPAGKTVRLKMPALTPGTYGFVGEYHAQTAKGRIVAE